MDHQLRTVGKHPPLAAPSLPRLVVATLVAGALLLGAGAADAAGTPAQQCQAAKNKSAGQYVACRQSAEAKLATSGDTPKYNATLTKCGTKLANAWQKAIDKAAAAGATCLDAPLTEGDFQTILAESTDNIATALAGLGLPDCPADLATCAGDLGTCTTELAACTGGALQGQRLKTGQTLCYNAAGTVIACAGTGQDGELQKGLARAYTDNGDGTITDTKTGLMWEKLSDDGSLHDKDDVYTWDNAFAVKVAGLNGGGGFAGHTDWRVPNVNELQSLVSYGAIFPSVAPAFNTACAASCTVTTCSCTQSNVYWSATTYQGIPSFAWVVDFFDGDVYASSKSNSLDVRGVRGGS